MNVFVEKMKSGVKGKLGHVVKTSFAVKLTLELSLI